MKEATIWSNYYDWVEKIALDLMNDNPEMEFDDAFSEALEINDGYLDDERDNLDIDVGSDIVVIANLGLWDGRKLAYRVMGHNLADAPDALMGDYFRWYVDRNGDVRIDDTHHDGTNYLRFRAWRDGIKDGEKDVFLSMVLHGCVNEKDIEKYTRPLGDEVARVYGW